jgi:CRISPR type I-E-associated protein CasB/Cse2
MTTTRGTASGPEVRVAPEIALMTMLAARAHDRALVQRLRRTLGAPHGVTIEALPYLAPYLTDTNETGIGTAAGLWAAWHQVNSPTGPSRNSVGEALVATARARGSFTATHTAMQRLLYTPGSARRPALAAALRLIADVGVPVDWVDLAFACTTSKWTERTRRWARDYFRVAPVDARLQ